MTQDHDYDEWFKRYRESVQEKGRMEIEAHRDTIERFQAHCHGLGLDLTDNDFEFIATIGVVANSPNIVQVLDAHAVADKDGLLRCTELFSRYRKSAMNAGYLYGENYILMLSPIFRRGMNPSGNWAPRFGDEFWGLDDPNVDSYIALDQNRVRINVDNRCYMEADTWFGAPFRESIRSIPDGSTYLRPPQYLKRELVAFFFASTYSFEVFWSTKGNFRTFQALEFKNEDVTIKLEGEALRPARYLHAEYDLAAEKFVHFDGAVQYFDPNEYFVRRDITFEKNVSQGYLMKARSHKVFKLNGIVQQEDWVNLCSHFCSGDPLVIEYFSGAYPAHITEAVERLRSNLDDVT